MATGGDPVSRRDPGEVAERLNAPVLKTGVAFGSPWVRIPPSPFEDSTRHRTKRRRHRGRNQPAWPEDCSNCPSPSSDPGSRRLVIQSTRKPTTAAITKRMESA